jgi:predicted transcriptional regulator YdeE
MLKLIQWAVVALFVCQSLEAHIPTEGQIMHESKEEKRYVIGISIKTSNEHFLKEAPPLWEKFYAEKLSDKTPNRLNQNLLALYTEYEGAFTKPYTYVIGCEVANLDIIPEGMIGVEIPASENAVYTVKGPFPQAMMQAWQNIWSSPLKRSYTTDFEVYPPGFNQQALPEIKIYIALDKI